jgi:hypothetical protein
MNRWYSEVLYNFMLVMTNNGMRPPDVSNLPITRAGAIGARAALRLFAKTL